MGLKFDTLHCALLVAIVLLAVYTFGSFREGAVYNPNATLKSFSGELGRANKWINSHEGQGKWPTWQTDQALLRHVRFAHMK